MGRVVKYRNDALGRTTLVTYPTNDFASYSYNDQFNYVDVSNEMGWKTRQTYDGLGRPSITEAFSGASSYSSSTLTHNWLNLVVAETDPLGHSTKIQYDALGRPLNATRPDGTVTFQFYDDLDGWVRSTDEYGNYRCSIYDRLGRVTTVIEDAYSDCTYSLLLTATATHILVR